jgi:hypothetical protein
MLYCYVYQFNTGDEDDEKADSNDYSINKRTKEQHSAKFCLSRKSSMKDTKEKERKKTMTINVYKDGHSQILFLKDKKREIYVYVFIMSNRKKRRIYTHDT